MAANFIRHSRHRNAWSGNRSTVSRLTRRSLLQSVGRENEFPGNAMSEKPSFFAELRRRNVYKVAITYAVVAWLFVQAASILLPTFDAPSWVMKTLVVLLALGFAMAVFISWAFEATPEGLKRTENVPPDVAAKLPTWSPRKFATFIVAVAVIAAGLLAYQFLRTARSTIISSAENKSIAVLPFVNMSADKNDEYLS